MASFFDSEFSQNFRSIEKNIKRFQEKINLDFEDITAHKFYAKILLNNQILVE